MKTLSRTLLVVGVALVPLSMTDTASGQYWYPRQYGYIHPHHDYPYPHDFEDPSMPGRDPASIYSHGYRNDVASDYSDYYDYYASPPAAGEEPGDYARQYDYYYNYPGGPPGRGGYYDGLGDEWDEVDNEERIVGQRDEEQIAGEEMDEDWNQAAGEVLHENWNEDVEEGIGKEVNQIDEEIEEEAETLDEEWVEVGEPVDEVPGPNEIYDYEEVYDRMDDDETDRFDRADDLDRFEDDPEPHDADVYGEIDPVWDADLDDKFWYDDNPYDEYLGSPPPYAGGHLSEEEEEFSEYYEFYDEP